MRQFKIAVEFEKLKKGFEFDPKEITNHKILKNTLRRRHLGIGRAAMAFEVDIRNLSLIINGHSSTIRVIQSIQDDLGLTNKQVLQLWPQLKEWPRLPYSRVRTAKQRNRLNNRKKELV